MAKSFDALVKRTTTKKTQATAARRAQELLGELLLSEVRQLTGKSQQEVAQTLGMKQPSLSKLEKQADMQISTLRMIVQALGGEFVIITDGPSTKNLAIPFFLVPIIRSAHSDFPAPAAQV